MVATLLFFTSLALVLCVAVQILWVVFSGTRVPVPKIMRDEQTIGAGPSLRYLVMGDSTSIAQGGDYIRGYAVATAKYLAKKHTVTWKNIGISGARAYDVLEQQLPAALAFSPDLVLLAVGANDVTHFTNLDVVRNSLERVVQSLQDGNPNVRIVLTGAPAMGTVPRFLRLTRSLMGRRTRAVNNQVVEVARHRRVVFAPIAEETEEIYRTHPELFAADKFHPTTEGYLPWIPVLKHAIDKTKV